MSAMFQKSPNVRNFCCRYNGMCTYHPKKLQKYERFWLNKFPALVDLVAMAFVVVVSMLFSVIDDVMTCC